MPHESCMKSKPALPPLRTSGGISKTVKLMDLFSVMKTTT